MAWNILKESDVLKKALDNNEFILNYQPIVDAVTYETLWVEALMRWRSNIIGTVSPDKFIPALEEKNLMLPVGEWVLKNACSQLKKWRNRGYVSSGISVNVSPVQLRQHDFAETVQNVLAETGLKPEDISLEITESIKLEKAPYIIKMLKDLRKTGVRISIDDFGTGYNCLKYLQELEFTSLKIDRAFVANLENDRGRMLIDSIISLGHRMGVKVIAEGTETVEQCEQLKEMGCDMLQGYYFCKPVPAERLCFFLENNRMNERNGSE